MVSMERSAVAAVRTVVHPLSGRVNTGELRYREEIQPTEASYDDPAKWISRLGEHLGVIPFLTSLVPFHGRILELGAGSCWLGASLSKIQDVNEVFCADISHHILSAIAPQVISHLGARSEKMTLVVADFNELHFEDSTFDYVLMDQALHHVPTKNFGAVVREILRVMKDSGAFIAIGEPFVAPIPVFSALKKSVFGRHERSYGVTENLCTKAEWKQLLRQNGMAVEFVPDALRVTPDARFKNLLKALILKLRLQGLYLFFRPNYVIIGRKR